jgi:hypothetical protein
MERARYNSCVHSLRVPQAACLSLREYDCLDTDESVRVRSDVPSIWLQRDPKQPPSSTRVEVTENPNINGLYSKTRRDDRQHGIGRLDWFRPGLFCNIVELCSIQYEGIAGSASS